MKNLAEPMTTRPERVYVDLDDTLLRSDMLFESIAVMIRQAPLSLLLLPFWLLKGRAYLKARIMERHVPHIAVLPYRKEVLDYLREQKAGGRRLIMATASNEMPARKLAEHLGIFDEVLASSAHENLKGVHKAKRILEHASGSAFTYVGDSKADLQIWRHAGTGVLVGASRSVAAAARKLTQIEAEFPDRRRLGSYIRAIRAYQWMKNLLVFVPLLVAHRWGGNDAIVSSLLAFLAFSACASAIYLVNDLVDLSADRSHPRKCRRPLASGAVPLVHAMLLVLPLLALGVAIALTLGTAFSAAIAVYVVTTLLYSIHFKEYVLLDVFMLATLYTIRVIGGAAAINVLPSFWLLAFSMFIFFSLALVKRCSELLVMQQSQRESAQGRDYRTADYSVLQAIGVASGFSAVVVFALYINSPVVIESYRHPHMLWLICGTLAYWISRMWIKTVRGEMHDDPLLYAARDRGSAVMVVLSAISFILAMR